MVLIQVNPISIQSSLDHQILYGVISQGPMPQLSLKGTIFIQQHCNTVKIASKSRKTRWLILFLCMNNGCITAKPNDKLKLHTSQHISHLTVQTTHQTYVSRPTEASLPIWKMCLPPDMGGGDGKRHFQVVESWCTRQRKHWHSIHPLREPHRPTEKLCLHQTCVSRMEATTKRGIWTLCHRPKKHGQRL